MYLGAGGDVAVRGEKNRIGIDGDVAAVTCVRIGGEVTVFKRNVGGGIDGHITAFAFAGCNTGVNGAVMGQLDVFAGDVDIASQRVCGIGFDGTVVKG